MLVTAIALFFSTFSTPILSAALTFGLFIAGHFSADLRNFKQVVDSPAAAALARGLYWVLPNLAQFDVKSAGRPRPARAVRVHRADDRVRRAVHRDAARGCGRSFSRGGTSSEAGDRRCRCARRRRCSLALLTAAAASRRSASGAYPPRPRPPRLALPHLGDGCPAADGRLQRAGGRPVLDSRDSVLRCRAQAPGEAASAGPEPPPALAPTPDGYPLLYPLLDLTTTLDPRFNIAYRFGAIFLAEPYPAAPVGRIWRSRSSKRDCAERPDKWEYMQDIGFVHYWWRHDYQAAAEWFDRRSQVPGAPWWLRSLAATTLARGRRSAVVAHDVGGDSRSRRRSTGCGDDAERRLAQLRALDEIDALQQAIERVHRASGRHRPPTGALIRAGGAFRGIPLDPTRHAVRDRLGRRVRLSPIVAALAAARRARR